MPNVTALLSERESRYGSFPGQAALSQRLKHIMMQARHWDELSHDQREALEMIQHKVGRILNGNADYADNWIDVAGYATLVATRLEKVA